MKKAFLILILFIIFFTVTHAEAPDHDDVNFLPEKSKAEYYFDKGISHYNLNQYSEALKFLNLALEIYKKNSDTQNTAKCYNDIGNIYYQLNIFNKAMESHLRSLKLSESLKDTKGIISSLNNVGNVLNKLEKFDEALEKYQKALNLSYEIEDSKSLAITLNNIGNIYLSKEDYENALSFYNRSLILKQQLHDNVGIATSHNNIGIAYQGLGNISKALENYKISLEMMKVLQNGDGITSAYFHTGICYYENDNEKKASYNLEKALAYAKNYDNKQIMISCYNVLSEIYAKQRKYRKAYTAMKQYAKVKDELVSVNTQKVVAELQIKYETEKKERQIELLQNKASLTDYRSKTNEMFMIILVVVLVSVTVLGFFFYFQFRQKAKSNRIIEEQNLELTMAYKKMEELARTDVLTGLSNRRDMYQKIKHETDRFERNDNPFAILMGDIDNFKKINDTYGHEAGDHVLVSISNLLKSFMRKQDLVSRWGGEEFLLLLPETNLAGAKKIAEKLRSKINRETIDYKDNHIKVTITIGISVYERIHDVNECITAADKAMYFGKIRNKNCVVTADDI